MRIQYGDSKLDYAEIVTIATENLLALNEFRTAIGAAGPFLSDMDRHMLSDLDIGEYTETH